MYIGLELIQENVGIMIEHVILIILIIGGFIFYAKDFKIGLMLHMASFGLIFIYFYESSLYYSSSIVMFFITFILLCLSLYASSKVTQTGGIV